MPIADAVLPWVAGMDGKIIVYRVPIAERKQIPGGPTHFTRETSCIKTAWKAICKDAGVTGATPKTLRHTMLTWLAERGVPKEQRMTLAGHSAQDTTAKNYEHLSPHYLRTAIAEIDAYFDELARSDRAEILILDDAHRFPCNTLDDLRLLSNLDFDRTPPFALLLVGQPPLRDTLAQPELASLQQRLAIHAALSPLTEQEAADYLDRRMRAAGARATLFRPAAVAKLFEKTRGVPRLINNLATAALLAAAATGRKHVDVQDVDDAFFDSENA